MHVDSFGRWWMSIDLNYMNAKQSRALFNFIQLEHQIMLYLKYGLERYLVSALHGVVMNGEIVNP